MSYGLIPESYVDLSAEEKKLKAQQFFDHIKIRYEEFDTQGLQYMETINLLLKSKASIEELKRTLLQPECKRVCNVDNRFVEFLTMLTIAEKAQLLNEKSFLEKLDSLDKAQVFWQSLHFYLRRIEFGWSRGEWEEIVPFIVEFDISSVCLAEVICRSGKYKRPRYVCSQIATALEEHGMMTDALKLLALADAYLEVETEG